MRNKVTVIFCIFYLLYFKSKAIDTIYTSNDSTKIKKIEGIIEKYKLFPTNKDIYEKLNSYLEAYKLSKEINHSLLMAKLEFSIAEFYNLNELDKLKALEYYLKSIESYKLSNNTTHYLDIFTNYMSIIKINILNEDNEVNKFLIDSAVFYLNKINVPKERFISIINIVDMYYQLKEFKTTDKYIKELDFLDKTIDDSILTKIRYEFHEKKNLSEKKYLKALIYNDSSILISHIIPDKSFLMYDYMRRGTLLFQMSNYTQSLAFLNKSYEIAQHLNHPKFKVINLYEMASSLFKIGSYELSKKYAEQSLTISLNSNMKKDIMKTSFLLYQIDSLQNNHESAIKHLRDYIAFKDSINKTNSKQYNAINNYFEYARLINNNFVLQEENKENELKIENEKQLNKYLIIFLIFVTIIAILMFYFYIIYSKLTNLLNNQKNQIITKNKEFKEKNDFLQKTIQEKNDLISVVSHDLKAPLNRAEALVGLIKTTTDNFNDEQHFLFNKLTKEIQNQKELITDIFNAELLELEVGNLQFEEINVNEVFKKFTSENQVSASMKDIKITFVPYPNTIYISANQTFLKRICDNLISNAIKFSERGKNIQVLIDALDKEVHIHFKDEGQGFTETDQLDLFKKYHKLSSKPTEGESSTGLGLSIVKNLVFAMKGNISLISKKDKGSTFTLTFKKISYTLS